MIFNKTKLLRFHDPSHGLEYNSISLNRRISGYSTSIDVAKTPRVVKDLYNDVNVNGEAKMANSHNLLINQTEFLFNRKRR